MHFKTYSGSTLIPQMEKESDITIELIARGLSMVVRYAGHTSKPITVARHSVNVSKTVSKEYALEALLHDATEALMGDTTAPYKRLIVGFDEIEGRLDRVIRRKFGLPEEMSPMVRMMDIHERDREMADKAETDFASWQVDHYRDYEVFIARFEQLTA